MALIADPGAAGETASGLGTPRPPQGGVIEEARRRRRRRRAVGFAFAAIAVTVAIGAWLTSGGAGGGGGGVSTAGRGAKAAGRGAKLTLVHGEALSDGQPAIVGLAPSLQAGNVGVCVAVVNSEDCNDPPPTKHDPVYGVAGFSPEEAVGPGGEIDAVFTGPGVAAIRVAHFGTFQARPVAGLPKGTKEVVFYRPPGSRGTVLAPGINPDVLQSFEHARRAPALTETPLDAAGRPIPSRAPAGFTLPNAYWQGTRQPPAKGRCAMSSTLPGVRTLWGQVATEIAPDRELTTAAWLSCLHVWFSFHGSSYETALLLNASTPGSPPAPLWGALPVAGHPGIVEIPPVERERRFRVGGRERSYLQVFIPPTVARRVGPAWLLVRYGPTRTQRMAFLDALHVAPLRLVRR